jgi:hypothetical protein
MDAPRYEEAVFEPKSPPKLSWNCCNELFENVIPENTADL